MSGWKSCAGLLLFCSICLFDSASQSGNVGVIHYIKTQADYDWVLTAGPHAPYVAVLHSADFNLSSQERLHGSTRVTGILILTVANQTAEPSYPEKGYSSVETCPNDMYGLYVNTMYAGCRTTVWNPSGTSIRFLNMRIPVFELSDPKDIDAVLHKVAMMSNHPLSVIRNDVWQHSIIKPEPGALVDGSVTLNRDRTGLIKACFYAFNNNSKSYPVCAAELMTTMRAAVDAVTCIRRSLSPAIPVSEDPILCDPLGDKNIIVTMKEVPANESRVQRSVVMVATRLDATSVFMNAHHAADTAVTGIVTLLAAAEALWKASDVIKQNAAAKDIMFAFFQGETFDYIGSSRMVYDMSQDRFPIHAGKNPNLLHSIGLQHLDHVIELNQVGLRDSNGSLCVHMDPLSTDSSVKAEMKQMLTDLQMIGYKWNVSFTTASNSTPLPPSSAQRILLEKRNIPVLVLTDHAGAYANKFYNSRFDTANHIDAFDYPEDMSEADKYNYVTWQAELMTNLSTTLAQYLYKASTQGLPSSVLIKEIVANVTTVTHLLYCFLVSPNCDLFMESFDTHDASRLKDRTWPFSFYIGAEGMTNDVTQIVHNVLARFTGTREHFQEEWCKHKKGRLYSYIWMQGPFNQNGKREGWCYKSLLFLTTAISPAFFIKGYDMLSGKYSTWTESRWDDKSISVRLFLIPSRAYQIISLFLGVLMLVLSLILVYICTRKAEILFNNTAVEISSEPEGCVYSRR